MTSPKKQCPEPRRGAPRKWSNWRLVAAWLVALTVAAIILLIFRPSMARADPLSPFAEPALHQAYGGQALTDITRCGPLDLAIDRTLPLTAVLHNPEGPDKTVNSTVSKGCGTHRIWSATITVGGASDSTVTYLGYAPPLAPDGGDVDSTEFTYKGVEYHLEALFYQEHIGGVRQLVFDAGAPLPDNLVLQVDHRQFFVSDSLKLGANGDIHAWRLSRTLNWTAGQTLGLQIRAMGGPLHQQLSQCLRRPLC